MKKYLIWPEAVFVLIIYKFFLVSFTISRDICKKKGRHGLIFDLMKWSLHKKSWTQGRGGWTMTPTVSFPVDVSFDT